MFLLMNLNQKQSNGNQNKVEWNKFLMIVKKKINLNKSVFKNKIHN